ncbi:hypothetical protein HUJ04_009245, partial [Dendroctonus ponderosae]
IKEIRTSIIDISDQVKFYSAQITILNICESLMESYSFLKDYLTDIVSAITFARLKILHSSIITPNDLVESLKLISQSLLTYNLPLHSSNVAEYLDIIELQAYQIGPRILISQSLLTYNLPLHSSNVAEYLDIIELQAYQIGPRIVFVLNIPLVDPEKYTLYHLYPIPILDSRTGLHHVLITHFQYLARNDDSLLYATFRNPAECKSIKKNEKICSNVFPYPIDSDAICEAQLLKRLNQLPKTCQTTLIYAAEYNIQEVSQNKWLIAVSDPLPVTIKCSSKEIESKIINTNTLLGLQPECNAFIGSTRVQAKKMINVYNNVTYNSHPVIIPYTCCKDIPDNIHLPELKPLKLRLQPECNAFIGSTRVQAKKMINVYNNVTYNSHPVIIPYTCCKDIPDNIHLPELKPLKLSKLDVEDLKIAQHKLNQYSDELDKLLNQSFVSKHLNWFTTLTITLIVILVILYITCKRKRRKRKFRIGITASNDDFPPLPPSQPENTFVNQWKKIMPKRRPSINLREPIEENEEIELNLNKQLV